MVEFADVMQGSQHTQAVDMDIGKIIFAVETPHTFAKDAFC
jgi:hypothetical protein